MYINLGKIFRGIPIFSFEVISIHNAFKVFINIHVNNICNHPFHCDTIDVNECNEGTHDCPQECHLPSILWAASTALAMKASSITALIHLNPAEAAKVCLCHNREFSIAVNVAASQRSRENVCPQHKGYCALCLRSLVDVQSKTA